MQKRYQHIEIRTDLHDYLREILNHSEEGWELVQVLPFGDLTFRVLMKRPIMDSDLSSIMTESQRRTAVESFAKYLSEKQQLNYHNWAEIIGWYMRDSTES